MLAGLTAGGLLAVLACSGAQDPPRLAGRAGEIRRLIKANLHFDFHCWCKAADPATIAAVMPLISGADIPALIFLLDDKKQQIVSGAGALLGRLGPSATGPLEAAAVGREREFQRKVDDILRLIKMRSPEAKTDH